VTGNLVQKGLRAHLGQRGALHVPAGGLLQLRPPGARVHNGLHRVQGHANPISGPSSSIAAPVVIFRIRVADGLGGRWLGVIRLRRILSCSVACRG
jgi:hypothetical protein